LPGYGSHPQHLQHNEREKDEHESLNTRPEKRRRRWSTYQLSDQLREPGLGGMPDFYVSMVPS
jgi:hypothetical protein